MSQYLDKRIVHCDAENMEEAKSLPVGEGEIVRFHLPDGMTMDFDHDGWVKTMCAPPRD